MSSPIAVQTDAPPKKRYKMQIRQEEVMVTPTGTTRYPAGAVLIVDEDTAARWYEHSIADIAPPDAEAYGEVTRRLKREEFARRAVAVEGHGVFDAMVTRDSLGGGNPNEPELHPRPMPIPGRRPPGRPRKDALAGAVINELDGDED